MQTPSLFDTGEIPLAPPTAKKKPATSKKQKMAALPVKAITSYFPDIAPYEAQARHNLSVEISKHLSELTQDNLSQRQGMEWLSHVTCYLVTPQDDTEEGQTAQLATLLKELEQRAERLSQADCPIFPPDYNRPMIALDFETTGLDLRTRYLAVNPSDKNSPLRLDIKSKMVDICLAVSEHMGLQIPVLHTETDGVPNFRLNVAVDFLTKLHESFCVIYHNAQYDREVAVQHNVKIQPFPAFLDTQILDYLLDVNQKRHGLKHLSDQKLKRRMLEINELFGKSDHIHFDLLPATAATVYACSDAMNTLALAKWYLKNPSSPMKVQPTPVAIDMKLEGVLRSMYRMGAPVNIDYSFYSIMDCIYYAQKLWDSINELAGQYVEVGSPAEISKLLFDQFKLPPLAGMERGKSGNYCTDEDALDALFEAYPDFTVLRYVVLFRKLKNAISKTFGKYIANSFVDDYAPYARVQLGFSMTNVPTGRLSSSSSGQKHRVSVKETPNGAITYKYIKDSWEFGGNSQGIMNSNYRREEAKKILKIPAWAEMDLNAPYPEGTHLELIKAITKL